MESLYLQPVTCEENNNILASLKKHCLWIGRFSQIIVSV